MNKESLPDNPYILLTPGPLSTTRTVKAAMLRDWCTWDENYHEIVQEIRKTLVGMASMGKGYAATLMQGSGTFSVEAALTTATPRDGKLLVLANGAYGQRIGEIARRIGLDYAVHDSGELAPPDLERLKRELEDDPTITHVAAVHCETTTGMLNPVREVGEIVRAMDRVFILDAMSSFGGIPMDMEEIGADFLISSANKCVQGVPGFGFVIARTEALEKCQGRARSLSLDLYDQWQAMEKGRGKWRFTSPTHTVRAFYQALRELEEEGGVQARWSRYRNNHQILTEGMKRAGFQALLPRELQSPFITAFLDPEFPEYDFTRFYGSLKKRGFVIYPGKATDAKTFRIGNIGNVHGEDMRRLLAAVEDSIFWK